MIGLIVCVVISAVAVFVSVPFVARYLKRNRYSFKENNGLTDTQPKEPKDYSPKAHLLLANPHSPEIDEAMTDTQRAEELRLLQQAWNADQTK